MIALALPGALGLLSLGCSKAVDATGSGAGAAGTGSSRDPLAKTSFYMAVPAATGATTATAGADPGSGSYSVAVRRVNATTTICYDDTGQAPAQANCPVAQFDYSAVTFDGSTSSDDFNTAFAAGHAIVQAHMGEDDNHDGLKLTVVEAWVGQVGADLGTGPLLEGVYAVTEDQETAVNSHVDYPLSGLDFSASTATPDQVNAANGAIPTDGDVFSGGAFHPTLIVAGFNQGFPPAPFTLQAVDYYLPVGQLASQ